MNAHVGIDGLTALRRIDPEDAALGAAICVLLRADGTTVRLVDAPENGLFITEGGVAFAIQSINGNAPIISTARVTEAAAALDAIDPMLVDIEAALGLSLDATGMGSVGSAAIGIDVRREDFSLTLVIPRDHTRRADWVALAETLPPSTPHMPVIVALLMTGPRLTVAEASDLASGDLLLVPQSAMATLQTAHLPAMTGAFDFSTGQFSLGQTGDLMPDDTIASDFMVPLTIKFPDRMTSAGSLSALVPGTTLPLGPLTEGMPVELRVADRLLACGELVQLGDRFAVLIEDRADISDPVTTAEDD
jgi:flagellar motor switch/type III secretory pathway protein FliN